MQILSYLFLFFCCFSYIQLFNLGTNTDIQMYSIIVAVPIILIGLLINKKVPRFIANYGVYFLFIIFILILIDLIGGSSGFFELFRGLASYIFFILIPIATFYALKYIRLEDVIKFIKWSYFVYAGVGIIQLIDPYFLTGWIVRNTITSDRGVISLASEPAYFSLTMIMFTLILLLFDSKKYGKYKYITFIICLVLAKSAVGVIYSAIMLVMFTRNKNVIKKIGYGLGIFAIASLLMLLFIRIKPDSRLSVLLVSLMNDPIQLLFTDHSLNDRFANLYISFKYFFKDFFIPHGVTSWGQIHFDEVMNNPKLFIYWGDISSWVDNNGIATMLGAILFQLGILSVPYFMYVYKSFYLLNHGKQMLLFILIMSLNGLNLTNPTFNLLVGIALYQYLTIPKKVPVKAIDENMPHVNSLKGTMLRAKSE